MNNRFTTGLSIMRKALLHLSNARDLPARLHSTITEVSTIKPEYLADKDQFDPLQYLIDLYYSTGFSYSGITASVKGIRTELDTKTDISSGLVHWIFNAIEANTDSLITLNKVLPGPDKAKTVPEESDKDHELQDRFPLGHPAVRVRGSGNDTPEKRPATE